MANIKRFLEKGEKQKITKTKSFRLSENAFTVLETLSKTTDSSQNEILNDILDEYNQELKNSEFLRDRLKVLIREPKESTLVLEKYDAINFVKYEYIISYNHKRENFNLKFRLFDVNEITNEKIILERETFFENLNELLCYGIDSNYYVRI